MKIRKRRWDEIQLTSVMSKNIRRLRQDAGMSQFKMACRCGCTTQTVVNIEKRHTRGIKRDTVDNIATIFGVSWNDIVNEPVEVVPIVLSESVTRSLMNSAKMAGHGDDIEGYIEEMTVRGLL